MVPDWLLMHLMHREGAPSQRAIARELGVAQPAVARWVKRDRPVPAGRVPDLLSLLLFGAVPGPDSPSLLAIFRASGDVGYPLDRARRLPVFADGRFLDWMVTALRSNDPPPAVFPVRIERAALSGVIEQIRRAKGLHEASTLKYASQFLDDLARGRAYTEYLPLPPSAVRLAAAPETEREPA